jgi:hypothetical protein
MSRIGSKLENLSLALGEFVLHSVMYSRANDGVTSRAVAGPSTDERTRTSGCGEGPATKGDEVQRVPRWCKVLNVYLLACGANTPRKRRRRRQVAAHGKEVTAAGAHSNRY